MFFQQIPLSGINIFHIVDLILVRQTTNDCINPACKNDDDLCPNETICAPEAPAYFRGVETFCVVIFAIDYLIRIALVPQMPPR